MNDNLRILLFYIFLITWLVGTGLFINFFNIDHELLGTLISSIIFSVITIIGSIIIDNRKK